MPTYSYQRVGGGGTAVIDAPDRAAAIREIMRRGETPTTVREFGGAGESGNGSGAKVMVGGAAAIVGAAALDRAGLGGVASASAAAVDLAHAAAAIDKGSSGFSSRAMSRTEVAAFVRELGTATMAGLPLVQALRTIARQGRSPKQKALLAQVIDDVEHGKSLGDAAHHFEGTFGELTVNLIRAGEASGRLGEVLMQAASLLDRDVKLRRTILGATLYPMILFFLIVVAIILMVTVIVPKVLKTAAGQIKELPWPTQVVQGLASFFGGYWWIIIPALVVGVYALVRTYRTPGPRLTIDRALLNIPILGRMLRDVAVARFTRTLGTLTSSGLPILQSLKITKGTLGNRAMEQVIDEVGEQVAAGKTIADPMEKSGYFPPMLVQIVNLGERSGKLDEMLMQAANAFEDKTETSVKLFTTALPPFLVVFMAMAVGFIVLAILLPLLSLQEAVAG